VLSRKIEIWEAEQPEDMQDGKKHALPILGKARVKTTEIDMSILTGNLMDKEAIEEKNNEYGTFYQVTGELVGVNGVSLSVVTVWLQRQIDGKFQFVTLKPN
jgi:hypothetical protein